MVLSLFKSALFIYWKIYPEIFYEIELLLPPTCVKFMITALLPIITGYQLSPTVYKVFVFQ